MSASINLELQVASRLDDLPDEQQLCRWVDGAVEAVLADNTNEYDIAVRLVDEDESRSLNKQYRQQDRPTNVLSFPFEDLDGLPADAMRSLGDLVICGPVVVDEARQQGKALQDHWAHIVIHGTLHLLGYDHEGDEQAASMEALEQRILKGFGIENPYREN